jgi:ABC-2 type transport system permease protein
MNFRIISALIWRYLFLYSRTPMRLVELVFWPMVDLLIWGFLTVALKEEVKDAQAATIGISLIGGIILWDVIFRAQQGVSVSFLEDVWTRNLLNVFVAPIRTQEYVMATFGIGVLRIFVTVVMMTLVAWFSFQTSIFDLGLSLLPFFANLLITGWALGMISTALILRWGQAVENLAWAVPFFIQPFCAVVYPVSKMPDWAKPMSHWIPATHVFEGMREVIQTQTFSWSLFWKASCLNVVLMSVAAIIFARMLKITRQRGLLTKFATQ